MLSGPDTMGEFIDFLKVGTTGGHGDIPWVFTLFEQGQLAPLLYIQNAFRIADRLVLIREGEIVAEGTPKELEASQDDFVQQFLN